MKHSITIYCNRKNLVQIRAFVTKELAGISLSEVDLNAIVLAVDEVCANVIIHSTLCNHNETLQVFAEVLPTKVIFEIIDKGTGYDITTHPMPDLEQIVKSKRKGGVGLVLVHKIMDKIEYVSGTKSNIIRLIKDI